MYLEILAFMFGDMNNKSHMTVQIL